MKDSNQSRTSLGGIVLVNNEDQIADNLWIGGNPVEISKFQYVIAVNHAPKYYIPNGTWAVVYPFDDASWLPDLDKLNMLADMVNEYRTKGPTLVHCSAGLNRSALVVALALIKRGMTGNDAIQLIRSKRGNDALHNQTFADWLLKLRP